MVEMDGIQIKIQSKNFLLLWQKGIQEKEIDEQVKSGEFATRVENTLAKSEEYNAQKSDALLKNDPELLKQVETEEFDSVLLEALNNNRGGYIHNELDAIINNPDSSEEKKEKAQRYKKRATEREIAYNKNATKGNRGLSNKMFLM